MDERIRVIISGGGTGGHIYPALSLADAFAEVTSKENIYLVGGEQGMEGDLYPKAGYLSMFLPAMKIRSQSFFKKVLAIFILIKTVFELRNFMKNFKPDLVIGVGGYASVPALLAAKLCGIKTAILEVNSVPGLANKMLGKTADIVFISFENAAGYFKSDQIFLFGTPLRTNFMESDNNDLEESIPEDAFVFLVTGGSQGAKAINDVICRMVSSGKEFNEKLVLIHQCGKKNLQEVQKVWEDSGKPEFWIIKDYLDQSIAYLKRANLIISRCGAGTLSEILCLGKPAIMVPLPSAVDNHQFFNARELEAKGAGLLINQKDLNSDNLHQQIQGFIANEKKLEEISKHSKSLATPNAAEEIVEKCLELCNV